MPSQGRTLNFGEKPSRIILIAASLGGLEALSTIFQDLPVGFAVPILIVLHVSPKSPKLAAGILSRQSNLIVTYAQHGEMPLPGHAYFAEPDRHLIIDNDGTMALRNGPKVHHSRPAANPLFETAAAVYGAAVIGLVLTGGDSDGAYGLASITRAGGIGIVQAPKDAQDPDMPIAAIEKDHPNYVLPLSAIGKRLGDLTEIDRGRADTGFYR
jgi:two-component system chemotaxis response regulator CheB